MECDCSFTLVNKTKFIYKCTKCGVTHQCGVSICHNTFLNDNHMLVCQRTGMILEEKLCLHNNIHEDLVYVHYEPRKYNPLIFRAQKIYRIIEQFQFIIPIPHRAQGGLIRMYEQVWDYIKSHLPAVRCIFEAIFSSILFHMNSGILCSTGKSIVAKHPSIPKGNITTLRKNLKSFKIKHIRYGLNMLRKSYVESKCNIIIQI